MGFKYYGNLVAPPHSASAVLIDDFQALVNDQFSIATDVYTIQEESVFGSGSYVDVDARIVSVIDSMSGEKLSDDWRKLLFKNIYHDASLGKMYYFGNNYWLCTHSENIKTLTPNAVIRRCNESLRWIDDDGIIYYEPCVIDYNIDRTKDVVLRDSIITPQGYIAIHTQMNNRTAKIHPNQRFLFGRPDNRICWRIFGNGIQNSLMQETNDDTSSRVLTLTMGGYEKDQIQDTDNLVLGIADYYKKLYSLSFSASQISGNVGETYLLDSTLIQNNTITTAPLSYSTSSSSIATVSGSGIVSLVSSGSATITGCMTSNTSVTASAIVIVNASPIYSYEIRVSPSENYNILESENQTFTTYLYVSGSLQSDAFNFTLINNDVPVDRYSMTTLGSNSFNVVNINKYLNDPLSILATSGSFTKQIDISLVGAW